MLLFALNLIKVSPLKSHASKIVHLTPHGRPNFTQFDASLFRPNVLLLPFCCAAKLTSINCVICTSHLSQIDVFSQMSSCHIAYMNHICNNNQTIFTLTHLFVKLTFCDRYFVYIQITASTIKCAYTNWDNLGQ